MLLNSHPRPFAIECNHFSESFDVREVFVADPASANRVAHYVDTCNQRSNSG